jgi:3-deoxy-D-manno-octulosonate 8-phosphate phosphatase (KDO 8-P phosphatase)
MTPGATSSETTEMQTAVLPIRLLVLDIDGVLTDGTILLLPSGDDVRSVHFHDLDAVARVQRLGVHVAILSGEDSPGSHRVAHRFGIGDAVWGAKDKLASLADLTTRLGVALSETCYVGDADRDAPALQAAGIGMAPADGTPAARTAADHVLDAVGGRGVVAEAVTWLEQLPRAGSPR